ncbi:MAG: type 4a pilus biogenesis protein PilO [Desulfobacteraceae bacterium]|nr:type 4a pilus biogenesis protein PilO [Desulfobacteraceae bacterium]
MSVLNKKTGIKTENIAPIFQWAGALSRLQKILVFVIVFALIGAGYYFFIFKPKYKKINSLNKTLKIKKTTLVKYKGLAKTLPQLEEKLKNLKEELNYAMAALPDEKEIPILLTEISRAGKKTGLEFVSFKPNAEQIKEDFYAEIPVSMQITGRFHQLAHFFDEVSRLYRIVNIENIEIKSTEDISRLNLSCEAVTYMFVNKKVETKTNEKAKKKGKK